MPIPKAIVLTAFLIATTASLTARAHEYSTQTEARSQTQAKAITLKDDLGRRVTLHQPAERIAAASPAAVDLLLSLDITPVTRPWLPGRTPETWSEIPVIGFDHASGPNLEQLIAADPDLIIIDVTSARFIDRLESLVGAPVFVLQVSDIAGLPERLRTLGRASGNIDDARKHANRVETMLDAVRTEHQSAAPARVVALFGGPRTSYAFTPGSYVGSLVELVGAELVLAGGKPHGLFPELGRYSPEQVWAADPDVILVLSHGAVHDRLPSLRADPSWASLRAVRDGRVRTLSDDLFVMRPGADFAAAISKLLAAIDGTPADVNSTKSELAEAGEGRE
ncbi:MAG: ABC transporter substrate-binding protein [Planctomycetota bacterium]